MDRRRWIALLAGVLVALLAGLLLALSGDGTGRTADAAGRHRIVTGVAGEYYWTPDHHASFERIAR